jgi:hypothetical protein
MHWAAVEEGTDRGTTLSLPEGIGCLSWAVVWISEDYFAGSRESPRLLQLGAGLAASV